MRIRLTTLILLLLGASLETATSASSPDGEDFDRAVRPFLDAHCLRCHGPEKQKG